METREEERKEYAEERYRPIQYGGWKMLFGTVVTLVLMANCVWFGFSIVTQLTGKVSDALNADIGALFMVVTMLGIGTYVVTGARREWLVEYWCRNVVSYVARFVLIDKPVSDALGEWPRLYCDIRTRKEDADDRWQTHRVHAPLGESNVAISLPLGGYFAQSWIRGIDRDQIGCLQGWSVKLRAILDTGAVMVEIRKRNRLWKIDERIVSDIGSALRHLEYVATTGHALNGSWSDIVAHLLSAEDAAASHDMEFHRHKRTMFEILHDVEAGSVVTDVEWIEERVRRLIAERNAARGEVDRYKDGFLPAAVKDRDEAREERDEVIRRERKGQYFFLWTIVQYMEGTTRLMQTVEGLRVFVDCVARLVELDPGNVELNTKLESARRLLAEKELRARRRHGKKADPAPAPAV